MRLEISTFHSSTTEEYARVREVVENLYRYLFFNQQEAEWVEQRMPQVLTEAKSGSFSSRFELWAGLRLQKYHAKQLTRLRQKIDALEPFLRDPLKRLGFHTHELRVALEPLVSYHNHLVEGLKIGQLSKEQASVVERTGPVLKRAIAYFERCAALYRWHAAHGKVKTTMPVAPIVGLRLEELQEVVEQLSGCVSSEALEHLQATLDGERTLVELQQELGRVSSEFGLPAPVST